jgi:hypothetical protein
MLDNSKLLEIKFRLRCLAGQEPCLVYPLGIHICHHFVGSHTEPKRMVVAIYHHSKSPPISKIFAAVGITIKYRILMAAHYGCGAILAYLTVNRVFNSVSLGCGGNYAEHIVSACECGNCERYSVRGNVVYCREATVVHLLLTAFCIKLNYLYHFSVIELCNPRIVKGDMSVLAYAKANNVNLKLFKKKLIEEGSEGPKKQEPKPENKPIKEKPGDSGKKKPTAKPKEEEPVTKENVEEKADDKEKTADEEEVVSGCQLP